jgi:predicted nucleic acid-binding protein
VILLDTNVLIDGFDHGSPHHLWAARTIRGALLGDGAAINPVVLAELLTGDQSPDTVAARLESLGIVFLDLPSLAAPRCAEAYARYLKNRGKHPAPAAPKSPLPDFFIGAHASLLGLPVATADARRYQTYFPEVSLLVPSA